MPLKKSEFLGAWGKAFQIFKAIVDAILASGGSDDDVARLEMLAPQIAALTIAARPPQPETETVEEQPAVPAYPKVGEVFELALDGDAPENQPLEIVRSFGYNPEGWRHKGPKVAGKQTRRFKLVQVGYCSNMDVVRERLKAHGENLEGQWMKAFKVAYPQPDGNGPVGVADASWVPPYGVANFPIVDTGGDPHFSWAGLARDAHWRWLVAVK
jgi:hypothetical protein